MTKPVTFDRDDKARAGVLCGLFCGLVLWGVTSNIALGLAAVIAGFVAGVLLMGWLEKKSARDHERLKS